MTNRQIPPLNILFDIDSVLADTNPIKNIEREYYIKKSGIIVAAGHKHYIFIGALELIKWLFSKPYVNISFSWELRYNPDHEAFKNNFYSIGLACLKTVSPDIEFVTAEDYMSSTNTPPTPKGHIRLNELKTTTVRKNSW